MQPQVEIDLPENRFSLELEFGTFVCAATVHQNKTKTKPARYQYFCSWTLGWATLTFFVLFFHSYFLCLALALPLSWPLPILSPIFKTKLMVPVQYNPLHLQLTFITLQPARQLTGSHYYFVRGSKASSGICTEHGADQSIAVTSPILILFTFWSC